MSHFVTFLITLRVILCPLLCEVQGCSPLQIVMGENHEEVASTHSCRSHCCSEPAASEEDLPHDSCPDCECFCSQSAIIGMKVDLDDLTCSAWEAYLPPNNQGQASHSRLLVDSKTNDGLPRAVPGRSMRIAYASLLI